MNTNQIRQRLANIYISGDVPMGSDAEWIGGALAELVGICQALADKVDALEGGNPVEVAKTRETHTASGLLGEKPKPLPTAFEDFGPADPFGDL